MNHNNNRRHRRIVYEHEAIVNFSRIAVAYSVLCMGIGYSALFVFRGMLTELVILVAILMILIFGLVNYALVLTLLVHFLSQITGIKTPLPPKIEDRFIPVKQYGELKGHIVTQGGGDYGKVKVN